MKSSNMELIKLLELDMKEDVKSIDIPPKNEGAVDFHTVYKWYMEAEKLIRVLANVLSVPMVQAVNQLRYAGHHILKACVLDDIEEKQQNLLEGYKHSKRAVYDSLDFYVYKLSEFYRVLLPLLSQNDAIKVEGRLKDHIKRINQFRTESQKRIDYYDGIQSTLIDGLELIEQINEIQRESGISESLLKEKRKMMEDIECLTDRVKFLEKENCLLRKKNV